MEAQSSQTRQVHWKRPWLYPKQLEAIFCPERYAIIEASTKAGKTAGCLCWIIEQAWLGASGHNYWWVAPSIRQASIAYRRAKACITPDTFAKNDSERRMTLLNGTMIWFLSGEIPDSLYGEDVYAAVIDEASRLRQEAWHAVRSTLTATQGPVRIIGNVKGRRNWFYKLARRAESKAPNMHFARIQAMDAARAGILDAGEIADARAQLPEAVFKELYEAEAGDDVSNPFGARFIRQCTRSMAAGAKPICYGVDLAKSTDWTVIIGLDEHGNCCYYDRFQRPWLETMQEIKRVVGFTQCLVDSTGVGDPVVEFMQRNYGSNFESFKFTPGSKQQIMEGLALAVQHGLVNFPEEVSGEMEEFEYVYTRTGVQYSAPEGMHDDCVCALALAVQKLQHLTGALGLLKHYQGMVDQAHANGNAEEPPKPEGVRPVPVSDGAEKLSPMVAYKAQLERMRPLEKCSKCGEPLGADRVTDGFRSWHPQCDRPCWAAPVTFDMKQPTETAGVT
jgi:hypothetical protein